MTYSNYQKAIFDFIKFDEQNLLVAAVAGSGKSTTIQHASSMLPWDSSRIFGAFNKHIAEDLKKKVQGEVGTLNSIGWGVYRKSVPNVRMEVNKNFKWLIAQFDTKNKETEKHFYRIQGTCLRIVSLFKQLNLREWPDNWVEICDTYGTETGHVALDDELEVWARKLWGWSTRCLEIADFDDQIYQVVKEGWRTFKRDVAFIDEAQDLSPMQIALSLSLGSRIIACGDSNQAIYVFRGADIEAIPNIIRATRSHTLPLSVCYRCSKAVIREAQKIVPEIEWADNAIEGSVSSIRMEEFQRRIYNSDLKPEDVYVLCRTTAPLVSRCLEAIRNGHKAFVRGRDIGKGLLGTIEKIRSIVSSDSISEFLQALENYRDEQEERLTATNRTSEALAMNDRVDTIIALSDECQYVRDLEGVIERIFSDENQSGIEFSTVHKAKGREKKDVFVLRPDLMPHPKSPPHLTKIEMNLKYVAITRAQENLYWVQEPKR